MRFLLCLLAPSSAFAAAPPNILFMLSDDQAWSGLSCQMHSDMPDSKNRIVQTPNIAHAIQCGVCARAGVLADSHQPANGSESGGAGVDEGGSG
jgi:hypothetical protein